MGNVDEMIETINEGHGATRPYLVGANAEHPANASAGRRTSVEGGSWNPTDHGRFIGFRIVSANLPDPHRIVLGVDLDPSGQNLVLTWNSRKGMLYNLLSDPGLESEPASWGVWMGNENIPADQDGENSLTIPLPFPPDLTRFFAISEFPPPPLFVENFDADGLPAEWVAADNGAGTSWQVGDVSGLPNLVRGNGTNAAGTNLANLYTGSASATLTSPAIAIPAEGATLSFRLYIDNDLGDPGAVRLLDADNGDTEIVDGEFPVTGLEGIEEGWRDRAYPLPAAALGKNVKVQFEFTSNDDFQTFFGMAVDDVTVETP
jgi:hypothetical protein